jgi:hypothetical protein
MSYKLIIIICLIFFSFNSLSANTDTQAMFKELKILIEQNGKKIEQNGKKIEQNFIMIEQLSKRLDFMQNLIYIILGAVLGIPLYLDARRERHNRDVQDKVKDIIVALRELAQDDPKVSRSLKVAGII